jgi:hypothetical protein
MPYASAQTVQTLIDLVKQHFSLDNKFQTSAVFSTLGNYLAWLNESLDEIYADCGFQPDNFSITTVISTYEYPLDGTDSNFPNTVDGIVRVDYDGTPLKYRYFYPLQVIEPTSDDSGAPDGWYEKWDGGKRYLGLNAQPDSEVTLTIYTTRQAVILTAANGVPAIEPDFFSLLKYMLIAKCYEVMGDSKMADYWLSVRVEPGKTRLAGVLAKRKGLRAEKIEQAGPIYYFR